MTNTVELIGEWRRRSIVVVSHRRTGMKAMSVIGDTVRRISKPAPAWP